MVEIQAEAPQEVQQAEPAKAEPLQAEATKAEQIEQKRVEALHAWMARKNIESKCLVNHGLWARMPQEKEE